MAEPPKPPQPTVIEHETHLEILISKTDSAGALKEQARQVVAICLEKKPKRVLVDMTTASGRQKTLDR